MPVQIDLEVPGLLEIQRGMEKTVADLHGTPMLNAFRTATLLIQRDAKINAPVDTGRLRASITPEIRAFGNDIEGVVGSDVTYAAAVELGSKAHWLPPGVLMVWAGKHGLDPKNFEGIIWMKARAGVHYLLNAFKKNNDRIVREIERAVGEIIK